MGLRIVGFDQEYQQQETDSQSGNTRSADYVLGRHRHTEDGQQVHPYNFHTDGQSLQREYETLQREHQELQNACDDYRSRIADLEQQNEQKMNQIETQRFRIEELERNSCSDTEVENEEVQKLREALNTVALERDEAVQMREAAVRERDEAIRQLEAAVRERDEAVQQQETAVRERDEATRQQKTAVCEKEEILQQMEDMKSSLQIYENLDTASQNLRNSEDELERIRMQFNETEQEKGAALEQLQELNMRYQKNLKYLEFYQKLPTEKIDGLELFRMKLAGLNDELSETLDQGIKKAYVFRSTDLVHELEETRQKSFEILGQMRELTGNFELPESEEKIILGEMSTEECKRKAEEVLDQYEKTLKQMYDLSEKVLRIKNTIDFSFVS